MLGAIDRVAGDHAEASRESLEARSTVALVTVASVLVVAGRKGFSSGVSSRDSGGPTHIKSPPLGT